MFRRTVVSPFGVSLGRVTSTLDIFGAITRFFVLFRAIKDWGRSNYMRSMRVVVGNRYLRFRGGNDTAPIPMGPRNTNKRNLPLGDDVQYTVPGKSLLSGTFVAVRGNFS